MANLPFVGTITSYLVFTISIWTRFAYINQMFEQMRCEEVEDMIVKQINNQIQSIGKNISGESKNSGQIAIWKDNRTLLTKLMDFFTPKSLVNRYKFTKTTLIMDIKESIVRLVHLHSKLCDCVNHVNDIFSVKLFISVAFMFVFIVFTCFNGYRYVHYCFVVFLLHTFYFQSCLSFPCQRWHCCVIKSLLDVLLYWFDSQYNNDVFVSV